MKGQIMFIVDSFKFLSNFLVIGHFTTTRKQKQLFLQ
jgi:hypothetical protein